jgi:hypothetical protein
MKKHLKYKGRPLCGIKKQKHKLQFVEKHSQVTCGRCIAAIAR